MSRTRTRILIALGATCLTIAVWSTPIAAQLDTGCAPIIDLPGGFEIRPGDEIQVQVRLTGACSDPAISNIRFVQESLPLGLRIDGLTGQITGTVGVQKFEVVHWTIRIDFDVAVMTAAGGGLSQSETHQVTTRVIAPSPVPVPVPSATTAPLPLPTTHPTVAPSEPTTTPRPANTPSPTSTSQAAETPAVPPTTQPVETPTEPTATPHPAETEPTGAPNVVPVPSALSTDDTAGAVLDSDDPIEATIGGVPVFIWFVPERSMQINKVSRVTVRVEERGADDDGGAAPDFGDEGAATRASDIELPAVVEVQLTADASIATVIPQGLRKHRLEAATPGELRSWEATWQVKPVDIQEFDLLLEVFAVGDTDELTDRSVRIHVRNEPFRPLKRVMSATGVVVSGVAILVAGGIIDRKLVRPKS